MFLQIINNHAVLKVNEWVGLNIPLDTQYQYIISETSLSRQSITVVVTFKNKEINTTLCLKKRSHL